MGLFNIFKLRKIKSQLEAYDELKSKEMLSFADEYLKRTQKEHSSALLTAQRLNKAQLLTIQTNDLKNELRTALETPDDEEPDEDLEDEEPEGIEEKLYNKIIDAVTSRLSSNLSTRGPSPRETTRGDELEGPSSMTVREGGAQEIPISLLREKARKYGFENVESMSDQQIKNIMIGL